ncbi:hypothetical protein J2S74_004253 [Evansella vedderi]|uniref:DUF4023 domain-containing protein n=1 Tax=Evansella vedderi TaxID=38282 RepID=A0ABU0A012_9BACI|nr:DUF4023 domain-containing protein [Evansella vedderi]MDQ0256831.1 hypothetical protein [Evansella vedderi]
MDNTHEFVQDLQEKQRKDEQNKNRQGHRHASKKLPNKQHSTNK